MAKGKETPTYTRSLRKICTEQGGITLRFLLFFRAGNENPLTHQPGSFYTQIKLKS